MRVDGGKTWMRFMFLLSIADLGDCQGSVAKFGWLLWSLVVLEKGGTPEIDLCLFVCFILFFDFGGWGDGTKKHHWPSQCTPGLFIPTVLLCVYSQRPGVSASLQSRIKLLAWHHSNELEELFGNQIFILRTENLLLNIFLVSFLLSLNFESLYRGTSEVCYEKNGLCNRKLTKNAWIGLPEYVEHCQWRKNVEDNNWLGEGVAWSFGGEFLGRAAPSNWNTEKTLS